MLPYMSTNPKPYIRIWIPSKLEVGDYLILCIGQTILFSKLFKDVVVAILKRISSVRRHGV